MRFQIFILLFALFPDNCFAQRHCEFNLPGNSCYFQYIIYSPTEDGNSGKRPFLFILGNQNESADQTFERDTLKSIPQFNNYNFVYVPNRGGNAQNKLYCLPGLASLITISHLNISQNIFLYVYDKSISGSDLVVSEQQFLFKSIFRNIQLASNSIADNASAIAETFKAAIVEAENAEKEEVGTFYIDTEGDNSNDSPVTNINVIKTYFGPPKSFNYTFSGIVRDKSSGEALPFSSIVVKGTTNGTQSNADGFFTLTKVPTDTSTLIVTYVGYDRTEIFLTPASPKQNFVVQLSPTSNTLKGVTVVAAKEDIVISKREDISVIKITPKKLEELPNLGEKDVMRSFQLMPGVSASNESSSGLYVRGGTPDQNLVLYDGFTVYQVDHLYGFYSAFNANAIKDVQLYKGGFESRFGGRLSSVTEITAKDGNQKKFNAGADLSLLSLNAWTEIPVGDKFSSVFTFRKSYKGPLYNKIFKKFNSSNQSSTATQTGGPGGGGPGGRFTQEAKVTSYFYDVNGKLTYRPNQKDIISLSIFNGTDKLDNSIDNSDVPSFGGSSANFSFNSTDLTKYGNLGSSLKWSRKWNSKLYSNSILSYSNYFSNRNRSQEISLTNSSGEATTRKTGIFEDNDLKDYSIKSDYQWDAFSSAQLQFGGYATQYDIKYTYAQNDTSTVLDRRNKAILAGVYLQSRIKLFQDRIQFLPGIRASYFESSQKQYYEPRASLSINITDKLTAKAAYGKYYQFANRVTREDILSGSKDFWLLSDGTSVPVSSAIHYIAGLSYETNQWLLSAEGYYKTLKGLTEYSLRFNPSPQGISYQENFFTGYGYARGIEFLLQRKLGKVNGWVSYTLGEARNHFEIYSDSYYPANQDVTHEFKIVSMYKVKRWDFSATWVYATGRPYTSPSGAYSVTLLDGNTSDYFTVTSKNALRLADYHRLDVAVNFKLLAGSKGDKKRREIGHIGVSVFNVYDRINVWYKQYTIEDNQIIETNINYLGITPNLSLSLKLW